MKEKPSKILGAIGASGGASTYWTIGTVGVAGINGVGAAISFPALAVAFVSSVFLGSIGYVIGLLLGKIKK